MAETSDLLKRPVITEKASLLREDNKFVLEVRPESTKSQIREAIKKRFNVDVISMRTVRLHGKYRRRMGPKGGYQSDKKKTIVKLKKGQQITWDEVA